MRQLQVTICGRIVWKLFEDTISMSGGEEQAVLSPLPHCTLELE